MTRAFALSVYQRRKEASYDVRNLSEFLPMQRGGYNARITNLVQTIKDPKALWSTKS